MEPRAAIERARLALLQDPADNEKAFQDLCDEQIWAPAWMVGDQEIWKILADPISMQMDINERAQLELSILDKNVPQSFSALSLAKRDLGLNTVSKNTTKIRTPTDVIKCDRMATREWNLESWLAACQIDTAVRMIDPGQELAAKQVLIDSRRWRIKLSPSAEERAQQSSQLQDAGLLIPLELQKTLFEDGMPWSIWSRTINVFSNDDLAQLGRMGDINLDFSQKWAIRSRLASAINFGDTSDLSSSTDPELILTAIYKIDRNEFKVIRPGERDRLQLLLNQYRLPIWIEIPSVHWAWAYFDQKTPSIELSTEEWFGIAIDGKWIGWNRGKIDFRSLVSPGLHRLSIIDW